MADAAIVQSSEQSSSEAELPKTLAEHRAMFPAEGESTPEPEAAPSETPRDEDGKFTNRSRHRAKSQRAGSGDVPRIQELTKRLRDAERERDELKSKVAAPATSPPAAAVSAPTVAQPNAPASTQAFQPTPPLASAFTEPEPKIEQFANTLDPYGTHQRALVRWEFRKEQAEEAQKQALEATKAWQADQQRIINQNLQTFGTRYQSYKATVPEYDAIIAKHEQEHGQKATPLMLSAMIEDPRGPEFILRLAQNPDIFDELILLTDGKMVSPESVALTRRRLAARMPAALTGSVAPPVPIVAAPRPPNPVRTAPSQPSEEEDSGEPARSLAEHRRRFPQRASR